MATMVRAQKDSSVDDMLDEILDGILQSPGPSSSHAAPTTALSPPLSSLESTTNSSLSAASIKTAKVVNCETANKTVADTPKSLASSSVKPKTTTTQRNGPTAIIDCSHLVGKTVSVQNLQSRTELNGEMGIVQEDLQNGRVGVYLLSTGTTIAIKHENVCIAYPYNEDVDEVDIKQNDQLQVTRHVAQRQTVSSASTTTDSSGATVKASTTMTASTPTKIDEASSSSSSHLHYLHPRQVFKKTIQTAAPVTTSKRLAACSSTSTQPCLRAFAHDTMLSFRSDMWNRSTPLSAAPYFAVQPPRNLFQEVAIHSPVVDVLLLDCPDFRDVLYSLWIQETSKELVQAHRLQVVFVHRSAVIIARNVLILYLAYHNDITPDALWMIAYSRRLDVIGLNAIITATEILLTHDTTATSWNQSRFGRILRFCDHATYALVRECWISFHKFARGEVDMYSVKKEDLHGVSSEESIEALLTPLYQSMGSVAKEAQSNGTVHRQMMREYLTCEETFQSIIADVYVDDVEEDEKDEEEARIAKLKKDTTGAVGCSHRSSNDEAVDKDAKDVEDVHSPTAPSHTDSLAQHSTPPSSTAPVASSTNEASSSSSASTTSLPFLNPLCAFFPTEESVDPTTGFHLSTLYVPLASGARFDPWFHSKELHRRPPCLSEEVYKERIHLGCFEEFDHWCYDFSLLDEYEDPSCRLTIFVHCSTATDFLTHLHLKQQQVDELQLEQQTRSSELALKDKGKVVASKGKSIEGKVSENNTTTTNNTANNSTAESSLTIKFVGARTLATVPWINNLLMPNSFDHIDARYLHDIVHPLDSILLCRSLLNSRSSSATLLLHMTASRRSSAVPATSCKWMEQALGMTPLRLLLLTGMSLYRSTLLSTTTSATTPSKSLIYEVEYRLVNPLHHVGFTEDLDSQLSQIYQSWFPSGDSSAREEDISLMAAASHSLSTSSFDSSKRGLSAITTTQTPHLTIQTFARLVSIAIHTLQCVPPRCAINLLEWIFNDNLQHASHLGRTRFAELCMCFSWFALIDDFDFLDLMNVSLRVLKICWSDPRLKYFDRQFGTTPQSRLTPSGAPMPKYVLITLLIPKEHVERALNANGNRSTIHFEMVLSSTTDPSICHRFSSLHIGYAEDVIFSAFDFTAAATSSTSSLARKNVTRSTSVSTSASTSCSQLSSSMAFQQFEVACGTSCCYSHLTVSAVVPVWILFADAPGHMMVSVCDRDVGMTIHSASLEDTRSVSWTDIHLRVAPPSWLLEELCEDCDAQEDVNSFTTLFGMDCLRRLGKSVSHVQSQTALMQSYESGSKGSAGAAATPSWVSGPLPFSAVQRVAAEGVWVVRVNPVMLLTDKSDRFRCRIDLKEVLADCKLVLEQRPHPLIIRIHLLPLDLLPNEKDDTPLSSDEPVDAPSRQARAHFFLSTMTRFIDIRLPLSINLNTAVARLCDGNTAISVTFEPMDPLGPTASSIISMYRETYALPIFRVVGMRRYLLEAMPKIDVSSCLVRLQFIDRMLQSRLTKKRTSQSPVGLIYPTIAWMVKHFLGDVAAVPPLDPIESKDVSGVIAEANDDMSSISMQQKRCHKSIFAFPRVQSDDTIEWYLCINALRFDECAGSVVIDGCVIPGETLSVSTHRRLSQAKDTLVIDSSLTAKADAHSIRQQWMRLIPAFAESCRNEYEHVLGKCVFCSVGSSSGSSSSSVLSSGCGNVFVNGSAGTSREVVPKAWYCRCAQGQQCQKTECFQTVLRGEKELMTRAIRVVIPIDL